MFLGEVSGKAQRSLFSAMKLLPSFRSLRFGKGVVRTYTFKHREISITELNPDSIIKKMHTGPWEKLKGYCSSKEDPPIRDPRRFPWDRSLGDYRQRMKTD